MKSTFAFCTALAAVTLSAIVATSLAAPDTKPAAAKKPVVEKPADPDEPKAPEAPGKVFTNSVDMILLKVSDMWVGKFDVTQRQFQKIMGYNPSAFSGGDNPVDSVSWNDAMAFCDRMTDEDVTEKKIPDGYFYTLPTEDEWESFAGSTSLDDAVTSLGGTSRTGVPSTSSTRTRPFIFDGRRTKKCGSL